MSNDNDYKLKVRTQDDPLLSTVVRMVNPPNKVTEQASFVPAYASFNIASGTEVDLSYFYQPPSENPWNKPKFKGFDRHLHTEELWVCMEGDFYLPLGMCKNPDDPEDVPHPEDMLCFEFKQGDVFVLLPNVWHCGPWAAEKNKPYSFYMALSGHRQNSEGENVDHIVKAFAEGLAILPDVDENGRPNE